MAMVPHMDITVDLTTETNLKAGGLEVLKTIRPSWKEECVEWKVFTDGITNKLIGAWCKDKMDMVLVRVYGSGTEKIIDRKMELENMMKLEQMGCGSKLYGSFNNGLCYQFIHGEILSQDMLKDKEISRWVARMMASIHTVKVEETRSLLWERLELFISCCNPVNDRLKEEWITKTQLIAEVDNLRAVLGDCTSRVVFCHNDALLANIVVQKKTQSVTFIDMEYGGPNYAAFDIANHFCEFVGCDGKLDYERWLPSKEYQMVWIQEYLTYRDTIVPLQEKVEELYRMVQQFMLCAHLLWSVWAVIQAENSDIEFDFVDYALQRFKEYNRWKLVLGIVGGDD